MHVHYFAGDAKLGAAVCTSEGRTDTQRDQTGLRDGLTGSPSNSTRTNAKSSSWDGQCWNRQGTAWLGSSSADGDLGLLADMSTSLFPGQAAEYQL